MSRTDLAGYRTEKAGEILKDAKDARIQFERETTFCDEAKKRLDMFLKNKE